MVTSKNIRFTSGQQVELTLTGPGRGIVEKTTGRLITGLPEGAYERVRGMWVEVWEEKRPAPVLPLRAEVVGNTCRGLLNIRLLNLEEYLAS
jgi:hypothetical protein